MTEIEPTKCAYGRLIQVRIPLSVSAPEVRLTQRRTIDLKRQAAACCCG